MLTSGHFVVNYSNFFTGPERHNVYKVAIAYVGY